MRFHALRFPSLLALASIFMAMPAWATSFVPIADENLLAQTPLVVYGKVMGAGPAPGASDFTDYLVQVTDTLKGTASSNNIVVRVMGTYNAQNGGLIVPGAPHFSRTENVLLFLAPQGDNVYALQQFVLGAFHQRTTTGGQQVLLRDLTQAEEFSGDGQELMLPAQDQARDVEKFKTWLRSRAGGTQANSSYWSSSATTANDTVVKENFTTLGTPPARWFVFDNGDNVAFFASQAGQSDLSGGGFSQFVTGLQAWDNDTGSNVRYVYGGKTSAHGGLANGDGVNSILFNDPNNEIAGSFDCSNGGVLAQGGFRANGTRSFSGTTYQIITEVDIVIQNGTGCFMSGHNGAEAAEVYAHEIGHSLGLGHSCGDNNVAGVNDCTLNPSANDALMRAYPHADGRGASLRSDDQQGIAHLYPDIGLPPPDINAGGTTAVGSGGSSGGGGGGGGGGSVDPAILMLLMTLSMAAVRRRFKAVRV